MNEEFQKYLDALSPTGSPLNSFMPPLMFEAVLEAMSKARKEIDPPIDTPKLEEDPLDYIRGVGAEKYVYVCQKEVEGSIHNQHSSDDAYRHTIKEHITRCLVDALMEKTKFTQIKKPIVHGEEVVQIRGRAVIISIEEFAELIKDIMVYGEVR